MRSLSNRQLLVGGFGFAGVATLASFLILVGGLTDGRRARALESTVEDLRGELRDVRDTAPAGNPGDNLRSAAGGHRAIALLAKRLRDGLETSLAGLPGGEHDLSLRVVPAEGLHALVMDLRRHLDLADLLYEQSLALGDEAPRNNGSGPTDPDG